MRLLVAGIAFLGVACTKVPVEGQRFLRLPGTRSERITACVRVAGVSAPFRQRGVDELTAERSAIAELAAAAVDTGGNFLRVECALAVTAAPPTAVHVVAPGVSVDSAPLQVSLEASYTFH